MKEKWPNSWTNKYVPECEEFFHFNLIIWLDPCFTSQAAHKSQYQWAFQANANKEKKKKKRSKQVFLEAEELSLDYGPKMHA